MNEYLDLFGTFAKVLPVCHLVHHSLFPRGSRGADSARECVKSNPTP